MRKAAFTLLAFCFIVTPQLFSQGVLDANGYDPLHAPNTYRSKDNPEYWQNRKPYEGYWQQDVHYTIQADINEKTDVINGSLTLVYWNNSPDDLEFVYFHLYQNAFQPGSYYDDLQKNNNVKPRYGKYERKKLGTKISMLKVGGKEAQSELDNTILKVNLPEKLKSGSAITFQINFKTYFDNGGVRRRMKTFNSWGYKHYDGVHWYPRISVYDSKFGWTTDQHLGHEFYGNFGTFDVELTFANNFVVGATGFLQNRDQVLPPDLRKELDIKNFADKEWNTAPSVIIPYDSTKRKTWKYHAENVHDFAFTADPTYRIGEATWNDVTCYSLAQEPHASKWQNAASYSAKIIKVFSEDFGRYVYHKMIVADARDGMEYPMLTLDGGSDPGYRGLLAHEIGHNWFFGQVGNNETYRASLDEGFTQFLTFWALEKIDGKYSIKPEEKSTYKKWFKEPELVKRKLYNVYLSSALKGSSTTLNTHSDAFNGALRHGGGYRQVYYKTGTMLYNLQYVLGDQLFSDAMKHYFNQWKICHPYFLDFRNSIIQYTKVDLNWFFDQWLESSKAIDYKLGKIKKGKEENEYLISLKRKGGMQMPLDLEVETKEGERYKYHIPNTWFKKQTDATILPKWHGWDKLKPNYLAKVSVPGKIKNVVIDPSQRLADMNMLDNSTKCPIKLKFDSRIYDKEDWTVYQMYVRPEVWYNAYDGIKAGVHLNGNYMKQRHQFNGTLWFNTGAGQAQFDQEKTDIASHDPISYRLTYNTPLNQFSKGASVSFGAKSLDGLDKYNFGFIQKNGNGKSSVYMNFQSLYRQDTNALNYLLYPTLWRADQFNNFFNLGIQHRYSYYRGTGNIHLGFRSTALGSDYDYAKVHLEVINNNNLGRIAIKTRTFMQFGTGERWAPESELYLAGGNPEALMNNKYTRSQIVTNDEWLGYGSYTNHFHSGGGLNLRGYAGYLVAQANQGDTNDIRVAYKGNTGGAVNIEMEFDKLVGLKFWALRDFLRLKTYIFGDIGLINYNTIYENLAFTDLRADAGIGAALTIKKWGPMDHVKPLTIRFDMPFFLNRPPSTDTDYIQFRWVIGINRCF